MKLLLSLVIAAVLMLNTFAAAIPFTATAYCLKGRMANGARPHVGAIAADTRVLPLGTKVRLDAGVYSGVYTVKDRGVRGHMLDVWVPTHKKAMQFGRKKVLVTVLR